jgi:hypothetical protein
MDTIGCSSVAVSLIRKRSGTTRVFAPQGTSLPEMVAAIGAGFHVEEDFENAKDNYPGGLLRPVRIEPCHKSNASPNLSKKTWSCGRG